MVREKFHFFHFQSGSRRSIDLISSRRRCSWRFGGEKDIDAELSLDNNWRNESSDSELQTHDRGESGMCTMSDEIRTWTSRKRSPSEVEDHSCPFTSSVLESESKRMVEIVFADQTTNHNSVLESAFHDSSKKRSTQEKNKAKFRGIRNLFNVGPKSSINNTEFSSRKSTSSTLHEQESDTMVKLISLLDHEINEWEPIESIVKYHGAGIESKYCLDKDSQIMLLVNNIEIDELCTPLDHQLYIDLSSKLDSAVQTLEIKQQSRSFSHAHDYKIEESAEAELRCRDYTSYESFREIQRNIHQIEADKIVFGYGGRSLIAKNPYREAIVKIIGPVEIESTS